MSVNYAGQDGRWLWRFAAWLSQGVNLVLCNGSPDETLSGRAWRQGQVLGHPGWARARRVIDTLFFWQAAHCRGSHQQDLDLARHLNRIHRETA